MCLTIFRERMPVSNQQSLPSYMNKSINLVQRSTSEWFLPDFYRHLPDAYFDKAVESLLNLQNKPFEKTNKGLVDSPDVDSTRAMIYASALYSTNFHIDTVYKNQTLDVKFVPGHTWGGTQAGPAPARVMIVSKTPGKDDASKGRNFVSNSGRLLKEQFAMLNLPVDDWYITNLVKFAPPDNFSGALPKPWIKMCKTTLEAELAIVQPDFILCLGGEASKELLGVTVDRAYGLTYDYEYLTVPGDSTSKKTAKAVVCLHPSALAKQAAKLNQFQLSIRQFKDLIETGASMIEETGLHYYVIRSEKELNALVDHIIAVAPTKLALDAEWFGRLPIDPGAFLRCYQISWMAKHAAVIALTNDKGEYTFDGDPYAPLVRLINTVKPRLTGHSIKSDGMWLRKPLMERGLDIEEMLYPPELGILHGPAMTRVQGAFDTMLAAHAVRETGPFELESLGVLYLGVPRWDTKIHELRDKKIPFGFMPDEVLYPYGAKDVDVTFRLAELFDGVWTGPEPHQCVRPGYLDADPTFGLNSRQHFWISMMAMSAFMEMEETGILFDNKACTALREKFVEAKTRVLGELRQELKWPDFNPNSVNQKREMLFGEALNGKKPAEDGSVVKTRPEGALTLGLTPMKASGKGAMMWDKIVKENLVASYSPSTAKETLGIFAHTNPTVKRLLDYNFINQALNTALREVSEGNILYNDTDSGVDITDAAIAAADDEQHEDVMQRGLLDYVCSDGAVHSLYWQTKETGRASSAKPNLMAISKKRDKDYKRIVGAGFQPIRSLFIARPGTVLVEADFIGAELAMMAWLSGDELMIEHVRRSGLDENHPDYFDIHSSFAVEIFKLDLPPKKSALKDAGKSAFRDAVKTIVFGIPYGRGMEAVVMAVKEESGIEISVDDAGKIRDGIFARYPKLLPFLEKTKNRVTAPGYLRDALGGIRRFTIIGDDRKAVEDAKREAGNFRIQGSVARAMSLGLYNLRKYRRAIETNLNYRICNQIHDAAIAECATESLDRYVKHVLPTCLSKAVQFYAVDDDGKKVSDKLCQFDLDIHVYEKWGIDLSHDDCDRLKISRSYGKAPKAKAA